MSDPQPFGTTDPTRLCDEAGLDAQLRHDLELARDHAPGTYDLSGGLARFEQTVASGASTVPSGGSLAGLRSLAWFVGAVALLGGVLLTAQLRSDDTGEDAEAVAASSHARAAASPAPASGEHNHGVRSGGATVADAMPPHAGSPATVSSESVAKASAPDGQEDNGAALQPVGDPPAPVAASSRPAPKPIAKTRADDEGPAAPAEPSSSVGERTAAQVADEARQLNEARRALAGDPARALALTEAGEAEFPDGALVQERRGYAILALVALGRHEEAGTRAAGYLERWPKGPLSRRVREALAR